MGDRTWPYLLNTLLAGRDLSAVDTAWAMGEIVAGNASPVQLTAFTVALRAKGETAEEVDGLVDAVLDAAVRVPVDADAVDVVGTGGDQAHTVNISTMASIVVAGASVRVVKHGGRSVSSSCGSADMLAELGIPLDLSADAVARCVEQAGIGYCFAPSFHAGLRHAGPARREMGVPTVFNFIAPLVNPAQPRAAAVGCADLRMAPVLARVLASRGCSALVVHGEDGLDEVTTTAPTRVWVASGGTVRDTVIDVADLGVARSRPGDLVGGNATRNAEIARRVLDGQAGPVRDAVLVNAAAAIAAYRGLDGDLLEAMAVGLEAAQVSLDSGAAARTLDRWKSVANDPRTG